MPDSPAGTSLRMSLDEAGRQLAALNTEVTALRHDLDDDKVFGARNRRLIRWLIVGFVVHLVVIVGLILVAVGVERAAHTARVSVDASHRNTISLKASCEASNEIRALNIRLWSAVVGNFAADPHLPAATKQALAGLIGQVDRFNAPRPC